LEWRSCAGSRLKLVEMEHMSIYLFVYWRIYSSSVSTYGYENEGAYLFIGDTYDKKYDKVKEKKVNAIERYRMLPVRAVMDK